MAGITWRNNDLNDLITTLKAIPKEMAKSGDQIVKESVIEGYNEMSRRIDRVDTEFMKGSVGYGDFRTSNTGSSGKFGWGIEGAQTEPYFLYQEQGFRHYRSGKNIPPMHALLGAFTQARESFILKIGRLVR